jgi:hypothetical protein
MHTNKKHFFLKLNPPRPSFVQDMTDEERNTMQEHVVYWGHYVADGTAIALGPVFDPAGGYGVAVVAVDSEEQLNEILKNDPANGLNKYEVHPMHAVYKHH